MNLNLNQRPDVRNELNLSRIVLIAAGITAVLAVVFFVASNLLPSSDVKASGGPQKYYISGSSSSSSNISKMEGVEDGDTLELNGDFTIDANCYEMQDVDVIINMKGGDLIFVEDKKLYLGEDAVILCKDDYHMMVQNIGITGCDSLSNQGDDDVDCGDDNCQLHQWNTLNSGGGDDDDDDDDQGTTVNVKINNGNKDAHEKSNGSVEISKDYVYLNKHLVALRYTGLSIPQGATITSAYVAFTAHDDKDGSGTVRIKAEDVDDASILDDDDDDLSDRTTTTAYKDWSFTDWTKDQTYNSADFASVVQEVVDRSGWSSGNDMVIIFEQQSGSGKRKGRSYDKNDDSDEAPQLYVTYTTEGGGGGGGGDDDDDDGGDDDDDDGGDDDDDDGGSYGIESGAYQISNGDNDAHEKDNGDMEEDKDYIYLNKYKGGVRYTQLSIPQGATITSARIVFKAYDDGSGTGSVRIKGEDTDDANKFDDDDDDISDRTTTTAYVDWALGSWDKNDTIHSPDLSSVVQEIVDRSGWESGNDLAFIIEKLSGSGNRKCYAYDKNDDKDEAPYLIVTYSDPPGTNDSTNTSAILFGNVIKITPYGEADGVYSFCEASHSGYSAVGGNLLPVDLIRFEGAWEGERIRLEWTTASEENNSHFEVQRSFDGREFETIGEELGFGNSTTMIDYEFYDEYPNPDFRVHYYRLRQVDYNGDYEFHPLIMVARGEMGEGEKCKVYPNPANQFVNVEKSGETFTVELVSQSGLMVFRQENNYGNVTINTSDVPRGYYILVAYNDQFKDSHKIVINH